jgi:hypothetical protein
MTQADSVYSTPPTNTPVDKSRRHFLTVASAGAASVIAAPALPAVPTIDPVFALIEAKRAADIAHLAALDVLNEAERRYGVGSDEEHAAYDAGEQPCHAALDAAKALASTPPTTLAGVLAVLKFVKDIQDEGQWPEDMGLERQLLVTMTQAIDTITRKGAA